MYEWKTVTAKYDELEAVLNALRSEFGDRCILKILTMGIDFVVIYESDVDMD